jgi:hypothetical protein
VLRWQTRRRREPANVRCSPRSGYPAARCLPSRRDDRAAERRHPSIGPLAEAPRAHRFPRRPSGGRPTARVARAAISRLAVPRKGAVTVRITCPTTVHQLLAEDKQPARPGRKRKRRRRAGQTPAPDRGPKWAPRSGERGTYQRPVARPRRRRWRATRRRRNADRGCVQRRVQRPRKRRWLSQISAES